MCVRVCVCVFVCCLHEDKQDILSAELYTSLMEASATWTHFLCVFLVCVSVCVSVCVCVCVCVLAV